MKGLITFCSFLLSIQAQEIRRLYGKIQVPSDYIWSDYIFSSKNFKTSVIECGTFCLTDSNCEFYTMDDITRHCLLAKYSVVVSGSNIPSTTKHAFLDLETFETNLQATFVKVKPVTDLTKVQAYFFATSTKEYYQCSFDCYSGFNGCDIFFHYDGTCYEGSLTNQNPISVPLNPEDLTLYIHQNYRPDLLEGFADVLTVPASHWTSYIRKIAENHEASSCKILASLESWEYVVFIPASNTCYLGTVNSSLPLLEVSETSLHKVKVNTNVSTLIKDQFLSFESNNQDLFIYDSLQGVLNKQHCSFLCFFDSSENCDIFWLQSTTCYLGNFNDNGTFNDGSSAIVETYISKHEVDLSDFIPTLYPLTLDIDPVKWTKSIKAKMVTSSEKLCAAKATLYSYASIDFYAYDGQTCFLGDFEVQDNNSTFSTTISSLKFHRSNPIEYVNSIFTLNFFTEEKYWTPLIYESTDVQSSASTLTECGILCEISSLCDFFVHSPAKCYFGDLDLEWQGENAFTTGYSNLQTYHKSTLPNYHNKEFKVDKDTDYWANWIYYQELEYGYQQCKFACLHEDQCDFVAHQGSQCAFGNFTYSGPPVATSPTTRNAAIKKSKKSSFLVDATFTTLIGDTTQSNGPISYKYWPSHIYSQRPTHAGEHRCAQYCLLSDPETCNFYFYEEIDSTADICHFGSFSQDASQGNHPLDIDATTSYRLRNDITLETIAQDVDSTFYGDPECNEIGYHKLESVDDRITISNYESSKYYKYDRCQFSFYAPNAKGIQYEITKFQTRYDPDILSGDNDQLEVFASCGHDGHQYAIYSGDEGIQTHKVESRCLRFDWYADGPYPIVQGPVYKAGFTIIVSPFY